MADTHTDQNHPYHMVEPSPWPVLGAASALVLAVGAILFMHDSGPWQLDNPPKNNRYPGTCAPSIAAL